MDAEHRRQHFVFDVDQGQSFLGYMGRRRDDCRHRMAIIQDLVARQDVERGMTQIGRHLADRLGLVRQFGEIRPVITALTPGSAIAFSTFIDLIIA